MLLLLLVLGLAISAEGAGSTVQGMAASELGRKKKKEKKKKRDINDRRDGNILHLGRTLFDLRFGASVGLCQSFFSLFFPSFLCRLARLLFLRETTSWSPQVPDGRERSRKWAR
jgi:hypothetical protein